MSYGVNYGVNYGVSYEVSKSWALSPLFRADDVFIVKQLLIISRTCYHCCCGRQGRESCASCSFFGLGTLVFLFVQ